jgi:hypothetical protein
MSGTTGTSMATAIRPFTIPAIPDADLEDLRGRITTTRWPDPELVEEFSQGVRLRHRAAERHRPAHQPDCARRARGGCL